MTPVEALAFAIDKLSNEVEREFDGADVSDEELANYLITIETLETLKLTLGV
jgi:hypothetical protein